MCIFSEDIEKVYNTRIFARVHRGRQFLAYSMSVSTGSDLAMILPLPVTFTSGDDAVDFIDLSGCPTFFELLDHYFPRPSPPVGDLLGEPCAVAVDEPLEVHRVGSFEASSVPDIASFRRLDVRFRLPDRLWSELPQYTDFGFAVFKLSQGQEQDVHPMAFSFETRHSSRLFFPTLHIHHGDVPERARFDHTLYCQGDVTDSTGWRRSSSPLRDEDTWERQRAEQPSNSDELIVELDDDSDRVRLTATTTKGLTDFTAHAWKLAMYGESVNKDTLVGVAGAGHSVG